jgi:hypothetical protein
MKLKKIPWKRESTFGLRLLYIGPCHRCRGSSHCQGLYQRLKRDHKVEVVKDARVERAHNHLGFRLIRPMLLGEGSRSEEREQP